MAGFTTITTKKEGVCGRCKQDVPVGTRVRYNGRGIWHLAAQCPAGTPAPAPATVLSAAQLTAEIERLRAQLAAEGGEK